LSISKY